MLNEQQLNDLRKVGNTILFNLTHTMQVMDNPDVAYEMILDATRSLTALKKLGVKVSYPSYRYVINDGKKEFIHSGLLKEEEYEIFYSLLGQKKLSEQDEKKLISIGCIETVRGWICDPRDYEEIYQIFVKMENHAIGMY